jgi:membrane protein DedA with SNARE-associated domain
LKQGQGLMPVSSRSAPRRWVTLALVTTSLVSSLWFGPRTYGSFLLLLSAYEVGMPQSASIRAWMTLRYVATAYRVPEAILVARLNLPVETAPDSTLKSLAEHEGLSPFAYARRVQRAIADATPAGVSPDTQGSGGWLERVEEQVLSAVLVYGYPILGLTLVLGAAGLPLPTGLSAAVAGSLSALGRMDWLTAGAVAVLASILGDMAAYAIGRLASDRFLRRWGRWLGYMSTRRARAEALFEQWGGLTILLTRSLISQLDTVVSLLAGLHRYRIPAFLTFDALGRVIWTAAYMGLGYLLAGSLDAATEFLKNLTGFLLSSTAFAVLTLLALGHSPQGSVGEDMP